MPSARAAPHSALDPSAGEKPELRARMRILRADCDPAWGARLAGHVLDRVRLPARVTIAGFWPLSGEIDVRPLLLALAGRGHVVALPASPVPGAALGFDRWRPGTPMQSGRLGTRVPAHDPVVPGLLLVPLLAFDRRGGRLGYGGGYYDRTLAGFTGRAIGCGFAVQEVASVPRDVHDVALDSVVTEAGWIRMECASARDRA